MPPYTTYVLCHAGTTLLTLDASTTPPFTLGETLCLHDPQTGEQLGPFVVERLTRQILYRTQHTEPAALVPLAGQAVYIELQEVGEQSTPV
jgi:hypothetical protein